MHSLNADYTLIQIDNVNDSSTPLLKNERFIRIKHHYLFVFIFLLLVGYIAFIAFTDFDPVNKRIVFSFAFKCFVHSVIVLLFLPCQVVALKTYNRLSLTGYISLSVYLTKCVNMYSYVLHLITYILFLIVFIDVGLGETFSFQYPTLLMVLGIEAVVFLIILISQFRHIKKHNKKPLRKDVERLVDETLDARIEHILPQHVLELKNRLGLYASKLLVFKREVDSLKRQLNVTRAEATQENEVRRFVTNRTQHQCQ
ncbi:hypothetical protein PCE1_003340 [Barthelona sp. PCE]